MLELTHRIAAHHAKVALEAAREVKLATVRAKQRKLEALASSVPKSVVGDTHLGAVKLPPTPETAGAQQARKPLKRSRSSMQPAQSPFPVGP